MTHRANFADPDYEPSDDELRELAREAFEGIPAARAAADLEMRARIAELRRVVRLRFGIPTARPPADETP